MHERNENTSPPSTMLPQQAQSSSQHSAHTNNNIPYNNMHMTSLHKNLSSTAPSGGYHIPNMKEEPNTGTNSYSNLVNGATQEEMAVSVTSFFCFIKTETN